jgi:hypothetical protein
MSCRYQDGSILTRDSTAPVSQVLKDRLEEIAWMLSGLIKGLEHRES